MKKNILLILAIFLGFATYSQQSMNMTLLSNYYPPNFPNPGGQFEFNDIWGYADSAGREYAIFGSRYGTYFIDITNPQNPVEIDYFPGGGTGSWRDFKTYKHYAYGVADVTSGNSLQIFDLQYLPDSVRLVYDDNEFSENCHNIHVNNDKLYLISNTRGGAYYPLDILCLDDPENPTLIGGIRNNVNVTGNYSLSHDAFISNDTVYLSVYFNGDNNNGMHAFDMRDPENPVLLGSIQNYQGANINHATWMSSDGTHMVMADETEASPLVMVDITDKSNMQAVSTFTPNAGAIAHNPFIKDCLVISSYYHEGVQIYDVSNPASPTRVAYFDTDTTVGNGNYDPDFAGCWGVYPYLPSGNIIASDRKNGLFVLSYDGSFPTCSGDFDKVVEVDTSQICQDTTTSPTSLEFANSYNLKIYPNPSSGVFNLINEDHNIRKIEVSDINGRKIESIYPNSGQRQIEFDMSEEKSGVYFLKVYYDQGEQRYKIFKE